jgi:hypothetical protein
MNTPSANRSCENRVQFLLNSAVAQQDGLLAAVNGWAPATFVTALGIHD